MVKKGDFWTRIFEKCRYLVWFYQIGSNWIYSSFCFVQLEFPREFFTGWSPVDPHRLELDWSSSPVDHRLMLKYRPADGARFKHSQQCKHKVSCSPRNQVMRGLKRYWHMPNILTPANLNLYSLLSESDKSGLLVKIGRSKYLANASIPWKTASAPLPTVQS